MAKSDMDRVTEEKLAVGGLLVRFYFDIQHEDKERLQPLLVDLINNRLLKEPGVVYSYGTIEEPIKKDKYFITSATVNVLFESIKTLVPIVFKYAPIGIEVLKPQKDIRLNVWDLQSMLMDISQMSTEYSRYILEKVLKPEEIEAIHKEMENRKELGTKLIKKDGENKGQ
ncbi:MAG: hypothetical protein M1528_01795 [Candidatus Marsarchaeota archaeon]|jgi:hypothetical protein|nr:hypothetical protein [Candidatus Marsarchaeota archaeon]MCL5115243.1 hypothetical protein [Candidatus Marsarchaeota archaeon]